MSYSSGHCHLICLAMACSSCSSAKTIGWPWFKWSWHLAAFQIISIKCLIIAVDLKSSWNIGIIIVVSGLVLGDLILLALKANQDKSSWLSVAFFCLSLLHVFVLGILFGVSFKALGSWIVIVWFKVVGFIWVIRCQFIQFLLFYLKIWQFPFITFAKEKKLKKRYSCSMKWTCCSVGTWIVVNVINSCCSKRTNF